jgi:hypothetical protein
LPRKYEKKILYVPKSLKVIECHENYLYKNNYPNHIDIQTYR